MSRQTRRMFLGHVAAAGLAPFSIQAQSPSPNDTIGVAVVGIGRKGPQHIKMFDEIPGVRVVALCDCDTRHLELGVAAAKGPVKTFTDYRKLLEHPGIDAVVIVTPDHWHALMTVWACQAGKDVYVEKPVCHNHWEGRQMIRAARKYKRIVQAGTQNRSDVGLKAARPWLLGGGLGKIKLARGFDMLGNRAIGKTNGPQPIPATADYDLFRGPAPMKPLRRANLHYDWHYFYDTGTGDTANRGAHTLDHIRWLIGCDALPTRLRSFSGRIGYADDGETPNTHVILYDTKPVPILWEMLGLMSEKGSSQRPTFRRMRTSMIIECEGGYLYGGRGGATAMDWNGKKIKRFDGDGGRNHQKNFIQAMRSRRKEDLEAEILDGHISTAFCNLGLASHQAGRHASPAELRQVCRGTPRPVGRNGSVARAPRSQRCGSWGRTADHGRPGFRSEKRNVHGGGGGMGQHVQPPAVSPAFCPAGGGLSP